MFTFTLPGLAKTLVNVWIGGYFKHDTNTHVVLEVPAGSILEIASINPEDETAWLRHPDMMDGYLFDMMEHEYTLLVAEEISQ